MGYETKLIVGTYYPDSFQGNYLSTIAEIDLCRSDFFDTFINESDKENKVWFYPDGNTETHQDKYGKPLYAVDPKTVLSFMVKHNKKQNYRRYNAAIPMLKSLINDFEGEDLKCILYGH